MTRRVWWQISHCVDVILGGLAPNLSPWGGSHTVTHRPQLMASMYILSAFSKCIHPESSMVHFYIIYSLSSYWHICLLLSFFTIDINECLSQRACQLNERCVNTAGSYTCQRLITCPAGYQINNDICEGTPHLISIKVLTSTHSECVVNTSGRVFCMTACSQCKESTLFRQTIAFTTSEATY